MFPSLPQGCKKKNLADIDLNTLRVGELKKLLKDLGEDCVGCIEKPEFIAKIKKHQEKKDEL